ncbi:hypothetical protein [Rhizobium sp. C4]|uniref:hypothetical protein n=1 Tax=Rhizobium sp. C4 TaxID=1349800 RepID=UPI001E562B35|nr:hypothetical protein [Rhizobium sp. C4]MCD2175607.1 hypothetical protein [Rhizobium sp. C4]
MKRLMIMAMIAVGAGTLSGCVEYPSETVVVRHSGYYYSDRGYYRDRPYYRPRPYYYRDSGYYAPRYYGGYHRHHHHYW